MAIKRTIRGIRDKIPAGYVLGRSGSGRGQGPVQLIKFSPDSFGAVGGGSGGGGVTTIAVEIFAGGAMRANEVIGQIIAPVEFTLPAGLAGSLAKAAVASSGTVVLSIRKATAVGFGSEIGTLTFTTSASGVFSFVSAVSFAVGDRLLIRAPVSVDALLSDTTILIMGDL